MIKSAFPITIQLEVETKVGVWEVMVAFFCKTESSLYLKYELIKTMYVLDNKSYRIVLIVQSKLNLQD